MILKKYYAQSRRNSKDPDKLPCSPCWIAIKKGFPIFAKGVCWSVGKNSSLKFWMDNWVKGNSLRNMVEGPLTPREENLTIGEIFQDGEWNWDIISFELPRQIKDDICAIPMQLYGEKKDALMWKFSQDGEFNMASAYALTNSQETNLQPFMGNWVWKLDIWPKISSFWWLCHHNSVPVKQVMAARGINYITTCPLCITHEETILHLLRDYSFATTFWNSIKMP